MHRLIAAVLALGTLAACGLAAPDDLLIEDLRQDPALLVGEWTWIRSVLYAEPTGNRSVHTPASTGQTRSVAFQVDGTFIEWRDGEVVREGPYEVIRGNVYVDNTDTRLWIGGYGVDETHLVLTTAAADGDSREYRRVR